MPMSQTWSYM
ncbi:hypothetical protein F383_32196 [Gossypium arboreum]|uniref:Uncharacterized protein n=1 Tax=Gossypium arboreum TaxID=29729 RepID=A0A0B0P9P7_GOSAR|nr:hypothetical protein F383_25744 [Gossypium arboreum]KHG25810.1 hypothetical protein F383_00653 [Gossypium arboreum]KHG25827.1 hypothetical protein F383_32196 [Gossypium arboreum]